MVACVEAMKYSRLSYSHSEAYDMYAYCGSGSSWASLANATHNLWDPCHYQEVR